MSGKTKTALLVLLFLALALLASTALVFRTTIFSSRAAPGRSTSSVALENSYLFASPLQAHADGKELIRITVFLLDGRGLGIPGQSVDLEIPAGITLHPIQTVTDDAGKAVFDLSATVPDKFELTAATSGRRLNQKLKIVFY